MSYLLSATLLLLVVWPAYFLLLRYSRRYALNRVLFLVLILAIGGLPFLEVSSPLPALSSGIRSSLSTLEVEAAVPVDFSARTQVPGTDAIAGEAAEFFAPSPVMQTTNDAAPSSLTYRNGYLVGLVFFGLLFLLRTVRLWWLVRRAEVRPEGYRLLPDGEGQAFTFGPHVYVSADVAEGEDFEHVLRHERVHARQFHSLDILLGEAFVTLFWFHPVAWWVRAQLRANLEYLVDQAVVDEGVNKRSYQLALVRQSAAQQGLALALPFSEPSLKARIARLTGVPASSVTAWLVALGLCLWGAVSVLVINGTETANLFEDSYLAASAGPGDPYYDYYRQTIPGELNEIHLLTDRMLTGDEYLRLRGLLGRVPGARLYVYKNAYDKGFSLEVQYGAEEAGKALNILPAGDTNFRLIGIERARENYRVPGVVETLSAGYEPVVAEYWSEFVPDPTSPARKGMAVYQTSNRPEPVLPLLQLTSEHFLFGPRLFVNGAEVNLRDPLPAEYQQYVDQITVKGQRISDLQPADWVKVRVEGRSLPHPAVRIANKFNSTIQTVTQFQNHLVLNKARYLNRMGGPGTFREWFEKQGVPISDNGMILRYNDRYSKLDFLLDTPFGDNAMLQVMYPTKGGTTAVMVVDDYPNIDVYQPGGPASALPLNHDHNNPGFSLFDKDRPAGEEDRLKFRLDQLTAEALGRVEAKASQPADISFGNLTTTTFHDIDENLGMLARHYYDEADGDRSVVKAYIDGQPVDVEDIFNFPDGQLASLTIKSNPDLKNGPLILEIQRQWMYGREPEIRNVLERLKDTDKLTVTLNGDPSDANVARSWQSGPGRTVRTMSRDKPSGKHYYIELFDFSGGE